MVQLVYLEFHRDQHRNGWGRQALGVLQDQYGAFFTFPSEIAEAFHTRAGGTFCPHAEGAHHTPLVVFRSKRGARDAVGR